MSKKRYTAWEEVAHALTHGVGAVLSIAALVVMLTWAGAYGDTWHIVAASIYGVSLIILYTASTLYHAFPWPKLKGYFQQLDHAAIFLLIAGTYTPFLLINLRGAWGWSLLAVIWSIALIGVGIELFVKTAPKWLSLTLYLGLGWMALVAIKPMLDNVAPAGLLLLLAADWLIPSVWFSTFEVATLSSCHLAFVCAGWQCAALFLNFYYVLPQPDLLTLSG